MDNIYLSSISLSDRYKLNEIIKFSQKSKIKIEFSSGIEYFENAEKLIIDSKLDCYIHNYFPAPAIPYVINLASSNKKIRELSIAHCINGLKLSKKIGAEFYSAHAGFCIDPKPSELGSSLTLTKEYDRESHFKLFINSLADILRVAKKLNIKFLIENNVLSKKNYLMHKNPLLGVSSEGLLNIFSKINSENFGLLFDTAHFKVSCNTLSLVTDVEYNKIAHLVHAIHHSDNNGEEDSNSVLGPNYWFTQYYASSKSLIHVLEVKKLNLKEINQQLNYLADGLK